jgi:hypothetical protein
MLFHMLEMAMLLRRRRVTRPMASVPPTLLGYRVSGVRLQKGYKLFNR